MKKLLMILMLFMLVTYQTKIMNKPTTEKVNNVSYGGYGVWLLYENESSTFIPYNSLIFIHIGDEVTK